VSATGTFTATEAVQLAVVERSGFVESRHLGSAIVLGPDGDVVRTLGAPSAPVFPRSSLKPFQALAIMNSGVELEGASAVIATASHSGTPEHVAAVRQLLDRAGLSESSLQCPADWPGDRGSRDELVRAGVSPSPVFMNCSGKHAAMLLACTHNDWDRDSYLDPAHPLQTGIRDVVERLTGEKVGVTGVDGCGAPVFSLSLAGLARGVQKLTTASPVSPFALFRNGAVLTRAVLENGWAIAGPGRPDTLVIERLGLFSKGGAEGVGVMTAPDGTTVAVKMLDGNGRAVTLVALRLLQEAGALDASQVTGLSEDLGAAVTGGGRVVGAIRPDFAE
jgi:L-asparaginase II